MLIVAVALTLTIVLLLESREKIVGGRRSTEARYRLIVDIEGFTGLRLDWLYCN